MPYGWSGREGCGEDRVGYGLDGYPDYLVYGFPGEFAKIYTNPGKDGIGKDEPWKATIFVTAGGSAFDASTT